MARINTNISAITAQRNLQRSYRALDETMTHLATGLRISRGKDDPAGLIVSERLRSEISAVGQAISNTQRASLVISTAEGALDEVAALLKDIQAKIVEAANEGAFSEEERDANQLQIDSAIDSITRIANTTSFAGRMLLNGSLMYDTSGVDLISAIAAQQVHAAQFGSLSSLSVNVNVTQAASQAWLSFPYQALAASTPVTIEVRGKTGVTSLSFGSNTAASAIGNAIKSVADATGVSAVLSAGGASGFRMMSRGYGSHEFVKVKVLGSGYFGGTTKQAEDNGRDAVATVNGSVAAAKGNHLAVKTASLDLEIDLRAGFASNTSYTITGGGALFQVGPHVNTNLQTNIGVQSVAATNLGNTEIGFLAQVKTGGQFELKNQDYARASEIVDKSIDQISILRGRLGAFERGTLDTNINQLGITMENLMSAESSIRDADFAYETSQLARNQVLVSAGTTVLALANQTTQSVLRLLGG